MYYNIFIQFVKIIYFSYNVIGENMKTIIEKNIHELEIQKSRFICYMDIVHNEEEVKVILQDIKTKYPGATHYCYAYIIDNVKRFQDNGEPSGTAGMPILHVLESQDLQHVISIVIRYFGGIKLGAGGLVRAYTNSVSECLQKTKITILEECQILHIIFNYSNTKQVDYLLQNYEIIKKEFNENAIYEIAIPKKSIETVLNSLLTSIDSYVIDSHIIYRAKQNQDIS